MLKFGLAALLIALLLAAWSNALFAPMVFDDTHFIENNPAVRGSAPISIRGGRMLSLTTYRLNYALFGESLPAFHAANLGIHLLNVGLVYLLLQQIIGQFAGFLAAGLFGLHPLQVETVTYLSARPDLLVCAFVVVALVVTLKRSHPMFRKFNVIHTAILSLCVLGAILSKEAGFIVIPLLLTQAWLRGRLSRKALIVCAVAALPIVVYRYVHAGFVDSGRSLVEHALLVNAQLWQYATMLVYPWGLSIDHDPESFSRLAVAIAAAFSVVTAGAIWRWRQERILWLSALVILPLVPRFLVNIPEYVAEHHLYLSMAGVSGLLALGIEQLLNCEGGSLVSTHTG